MEQFTTDGIINALGAHCPGLALNRRRAGEIARLLNGTADGLGEGSANSLTGKVNGYRTDKERTLDAVNELLDGYGVETITVEGAWIDGYYGPLVAAYVNMGDTYTPTVLLEHESGEFRLVSWGDWLEQYEEEHPAEQEEQEEWEEEKQLTGEDRPFGRACPLFD